MDKPKDVFLIARVKQELKDKVIKEAQKAGVGISDVIRSLVEKHLK